MSPSAVRSAREALGFTHARLAAELHVTERIVRQWEDGARAIPRPQAETLAWRAALAVRERGLAASGLPECPWVREWQERPLSGASVDRVFREMEALEAHLGSCPTCRAREEYAKAHLPPLPKAPRGRWAAPVQAIGDRVFSLARQSAAGTPGMWPTVALSVVMGMFIAAGFSVMAVAGMAFGLLLTAPTGAELRDAVLALPLIILSYFAVGIIGGVGFGLLQPLRSSPLGWLLTGMLLAAVVYGGVGLTVVLGYVYLDLNIGRFTSVEDAWSSLPWTTALCSVFGGIAGLVQWGRDDAPADRHPAP